MPPLTCDANVFKSIESCPSVLLNGELPAQNYTGLFIRFSLNS